MRYSPAFVLWCAVSALVAAVGWPVSAADSSVPKSTSAADAAQLVREALEEGVAGNSRVRAVMLERAIELAPDYAPARWHAGQIRAGDDWLTVAESEKRAQENPRLVEYDRLRDEYAADTSGRDNAGGELELARWCRKHGLIEQARRHWRNVLSVDPHSLEALRALDMRWYGGALLTTEQIEQEKLRFKYARQASEQWTDRMRLWVRAIDRGPTTDRQQALDAIRAVRQNAAIWAFESVTFPAKAADASRSPNRAKLGAAVVDSLAEMPEQAATESLVRHAVMSRFDTVRQTSAEHLKDRPLHSYVPLLLRGLTAPLETSYHIEISPSGTVFYDHFLRREGRYETSEVKLAGTSLHRVRPGTPEYIPVRFRASGGAGARSRALQQSVSNHIRNVDNERHEMRDKMVATTRRDAKKYSSQAKGVERQIAYENATAEKLNERIYPVLSTATGQTMETVPSAWWNWWNNHNEYFRGESNPVYDFRYTETTIHDHIRTPYRAVYDPIAIPDPAPRSRSSCFPGGTLVWTETGRRPIESIEIGDCVLAQDPESGAIAYKVVLDTSVRSVSETIRIALGSHELRATLGHPVWAVGKGWRMAKQISLGDALHSIRGGAVVDRIEQQRVKEGTGEQEVFNLIVADFNTYFVGKSGVLVHDNTARRPTRVLVPGLLP